jgi:hypothetical protein
VPDLYEHELSSYKREIEEWGKALLSIPKQDASFNLTHFSLGLSNRANLMLIGMSSLVEMRLYQVAAKRAKQNSFKKPQNVIGGLGRLQKLLSRTQAIDFKKLKSWESFRHLYTIRNALVHEYGGVEASSDLSKVKKATKALGIQQILCTSRIRFDKDSLWKAHKIVSQVIDEINKQAT